MKKSITKSLKAKHINQLFLNSKSILFALLITSVCILLSGCAQISSLQTAKTLAKDEIIIGFSASAYGADAANSAGGDILPAVVPHFDASARQGFAKNFDAGLKISSSANIAIDGKYQLFGTTDSKFAIATGLVLEYQYIPSFENFVSRQTIPIYISYHPNADFAIYTVPRFIHQFESDDDSTYFLGNNLGLKKRINDRFSMVAEGSLFGVFDNRFKYSGEFIYQGGLGFVFDI